MSAEPRQQVFYREMDKSRREGRTPGFLDVANAARAAGLSPHEVALQISAWSSGRQSTDAFEGLVLFLCTLCSGPNVKRIAEYVIGPPFTTRLAEIESDQELFYIAPDETNAEVFRALFKGTRASVFAGISALEKTVEFDAIVCTPRLGKSTQEPHVSDGFGGEVVQCLAACLAPTGTLYWITGRGVTSNPRSQQILDNLRSKGLEVVATVDVAPGGFPGTNIEGAVIALRHGTVAKRLIGALRGGEAAQSLASALLAGPSKKVAANWAWVDRDDARTTFAAIEGERLLQKLVPKGRYSFTSLGSLLVTNDILKADKPVSDDDGAASPLFIPEYAESRVTADFDEQTVKPNAVYRLALDPTKANARFLARLLNSPYGKYLRASAARGATIRRLSANTLLTLELPLPDLTTQERIVRFDGDVGLLQAAFREMQDALDRDWSELSEVGEGIDRLKAVLDVERQIADWWRELPYPLAAIYRRYRVSQEAKERLDTLVHFFEMSAVYLATIGTSHVKMMREDWEDVISRWLHPTGTAGIQRTDFGFWTRLAAASLKDLNRIASDRDLGKLAIELSGPELLQIGREIASLGKATQILDTARQVRNSWIGHGGHIKPSDAARLESDLQQSIRDLYEMTASVFRHFELIRPGKADVKDVGFLYQIERLSGSDPTFATEVVELDKPAKSGALAFWMRGARVTCPALPFFRLGPPQRPQETSFYVFNRVEDRGFRWISYQEASEQDFIAPDDELRAIISLGSRSLLQ